MRLWHLPRSVPGQLIISILGGVMIMGQAGCTNTLWSSITGTVPADPFGILINSNTASNKLGALRLADGRSVFLFGSFDQSGWVRDITGAVFVDDEGVQASIVFENGLFKRATSADGSTVEVTYDEVSTARIKGTVDMVFASVPEADRNQSVDFDIDLEQAAADVAQMVRDQLGIDVSSDEPPPDPLEKPKNADARQRYGPPAPAGKDIDRSQIIVFAIFHASAFAALGYGIVQFVVHLVRGILNLVVGLVATITRTIVLAVMTPFVLMGEMLRLAILEDVFQIDIDIDLNLDIPSVPT